MGHMSCPALLSSLRQELPEAEQRAVDQIVTGLDRHRTLMQCVRAFTLHFFSLSRA